MSSHVLLLVAAALTMSACDAITGDVVRTLKSDIARLSRDAVYSRRPRTAVKPLRPSQKSEIVDAHDAKRARDGASGTELISYDEEMAEQAVRSRRRRAASAVQLLTTQQQVDAVNLLNDLRSREGASDMEMLSYNLSLENLVIRSVAGCEDKVSIIDRHGPVAQLTYVTQNRPIDLTKAFQFWYNQKSNYTYDGDRCVDGGACHKYRVLVTSARLTFACAFRHCATVSVTITTEFDFLVCLFWSESEPTGKTFEKGPACSKCHTGAGWCSKKLCNNRCWSVGQNCPWSSCAAICHNCATIDQTTCRCNCSTGWKGHDCSVPTCADNDTLCGPGKKFPGPKACKNATSIQANVTGHCRAMCNECTPSPKPGMCPPVRGPGLSAATKIFVAVQRLILTSVMVLVITV